MVGWFCFGLSQGVERVVAARLWLIVDVADAVLMLRAVFEYWLLALLRDVLEAPLSF